MKSILRNSGVTLILAFALVHVALASQASPVDIAKMMIEMNAVIGEMMKAAGVTGGGVLMVAGAICGIAGFARTYRLEVFRQASFRLSSVYSVPGWTGHPVAG